MPRRRQKRTDTQHSDSFGQEQPKEKIVHFGTVKFNRMLAPDQIQGDDSSRYSILAWSNTLQAQRLLPWPQRKQLFKRALGCLPFSYKIWQAFLQQFQDYCSQRSLQSRDWKQLTRQFEQALTKLPRMPRIWLMFAGALQQQQLISRAREVYNWAFRNLPVTQHEKIWHKFTAWAMKLDNSSTALRVIPRYLKINPDFKETFAEYLLEKRLFDKAAQVYQDILQDDGYYSKSGRDKKAFYYQLINLITQHPDKIQCVDCQAYIRDALTKFPEEAGKTWVKLSDYFIRLGSFDRAQSILEEAIQAVDNAKDFGIIFSAYVKFSQEMITALADDQIKDEFSIRKEDYLDEEIQGRMKKLERLLLRQPFLLLNISIKKHPNSIKGWIQLINLYKKDQKITQAYQTANRAIQTVDPANAEGKFSDVWVQYANMLQNEGLIRKSNQVLFKATQVPFRMVEDSLFVWRRWVEMLIEERFYEDALKVVKQVLFRRKSQTDPKQRSCEQILKNHPILWQLYIDLQINLGSFDTVKTAFQRCRQHRSLTPIMLLNYTSFLWENSYFQETFRVFQFALSNFKWPSLHEIWLSYISRFISRHAGTSVGVERARSIFERLMREVPQENASIFHFMYAEFEQKYGLYSHAIQIYERMVKAVPVKEKYDAYSIFISKIAKLLGVSKTRAVFENALQHLPEDEVLVMGRKYADIQTNLGEIQRARTILGYISQFTDPRDDVEGLWKDWQKFEVQFGDKQTYKQYLRIKRSVEAKYTMLPPDFSKMEKQIKRGLV